MGKVLFISDLDGTLLNKNAQITPFTAKIINNLIDEGMIFTYATARGFATSSKVACEINFKYPAVQHNGVFIQNPKTGEYIDKCLLDKNKITECIKICENNSIYPFVFSFIDDTERSSWIQGKESDGMLSYIGSRKNDKRFRPVKNYDEFLDGIVYEMTFMESSEKKIFEIADILNLDPYFSCHIFGDPLLKTYFLEIMRSDATKDFGVKKVKELVGADKIICFGDNINDLPMFNVSDEKYAVANAIDEIKKIATGIIGSHDDDGVARWLEKNYYNYI